MGHEYDGMRSMEARMQALEQRLSSLEQDHALLYKNMAANTAALHDFIELGRSLKIGLKVLNYVEISAKWFTTVGSAVVLTWATWKFLVKEAIANVLK